MLQIIQDGVPKTLGAGATELLGASGLDVRSYARLSFILRNTGTHALTNLSVYWSDDSTGTDWSPADATIALSGGTLAADGTIEVLVNDLSRARMRITATGTNGDTVRLSMSAVWRWT